MNLTSAKTKGVATSIFLILLSTAFYYLLPLNIQQFSRYFMYLFFMAGLVWSLLSYKKQSPEAGMKDYFNEGFRYFIVVTFFMAVYTFVFYHFNPLPYEYEHYIQTNSELLKKQGNRTISEINENAAQWRKHFMPLILSLTNFTFLILGSLVSAVTGYVLSRK